MYERFYNLNLDPFRLSPDHRFSYRHPSYKTAQAYMQYALKRAEGFVMITGLPGTGKTTLINDLLAQIDLKKIVVARLATTQLQGQDFLRSVAYAFGLPAENLDQATLLRDIEHFLAQHQRWNRRSLLIVDEAQVLHESALTELRLLANMQRGNDLLLQSFLVGQEELSELVAAPGMEQFHQRIIAACHLRPLTQEETSEYLVHRLSCAGWNGDPVISGEVIPLIHQYSRGIPRQINQVASRLLLLGCVEDKHRLDASDAREVLADLKGERLAPKNIQGEFESGAVPAPTGDREASSASPKFKDLIGPPRADVKTPAGSPSVATPAKTQAENLSETVAVQTPAVTDKSARILAPPTPLAANTAAQAPPSHAQHAPAAPAESITAQKVAPKRDESRVSMGRLPHATEAKRRARKPRVMSAGSMIGLGAVLMMTAAFGLRDDLGSITRDLGIPLGPLQQAVPDTPPAIQSTEPENEQDASASRGTLPPAASVTEPPPARVEQLAALTRVNPAQPLLGGSRQAPLRSASQRKAAKYQAIEEVLWDHAAEGVPHDDAVSTNVSPSKTPVVAIEANRGRGIFDPHPTPVIGANALTGDETIARSSKGMDPEQLAERSFEPGGENTEPLSLDDIERELRAVFGDVERTLQGALKLWFANNSSFEPGQAKLKPGTHKDLDRVAAALRNHPQVYTDIVGHTATSERARDWSGSAAANRELSHARAAGVATYLSQRGVPSSRLYVAEQGVAESVESKSDDNGNEPGGRVELYLRAQ